VPNTHFNQAELYDKKLHQRQRSLTRASTKLRFSGERGVRFTLTTLIPHSPKNDKKLHQRQRSLTGASTKLRFSGERGVRFTLTTLIPHSPKNDKKLSFS